MQNELADIRRETLRHTTLFFGNGKDGILTKLDRIEVYLKGEKEKRQTSKTQVWAIWLILISQAAFLGREFIVSAF